MNRKQFIQSHGASCSNWKWSWSFVNHDARFVIFGLWQDKVEATLGLILHADWEYLGPRKQSGYRQALEHIRLGEKEGYSLQTFPMLGMPRDPDKGDLSASAVSSLVPELTEGSLAALPKSWYVASLDDGYGTIAEIVVPDEVSASFTKGAVSSVLVNVYERSSEARNACIAHFGTSCHACKADFGALYGALGAGYIHVNHIEPIHQCGGDYKVDPIKDLIPVCANCHAMIHCRSDPITVGELRGLLAVQRHKAGDQSTSLSSQLLASSLLTSKGRM